MLQWCHLERDKTEVLIQQVRASGAPSLFSPENSEAKCAKLPFYKGYMIYRLTNYASLPSFSFDYLGDGRRFYYLDGSARALASVSAAGYLVLTADNVLEYAIFFFHHIAGEDGDIRVLRTPHEHPALDSLPPEKLDEILGYHKDAVVSYDTKTKNYTIVATLDNAGTLMRGTIEITPQGKVSIIDQHMLLTQRTATRDTIAT